MSLGERIRERRIALGFSQHGLADMVEVSAAMICQLVRGTKAPSLQLGYKLAAVLKVSIEWLLGVA